MFLLTKKNIQPESWELSFIRGKIRTSAWRAGAGTASPVSLRNCSEAAREELGYIGVFATKGREQEGKGPGLPEIIALICTSPIRASILGFYHLQDSLALTLGRQSLSLTTDPAEMPPKEEKGEYRGMIKVRGRCMQHTHILQKFVAALITRHKEHTSP